MNRGSVRRMVPVHVRHITVRMRLGGVLILLTRRKVKISPSHLALALIAALRIRWQASVSVMVLFREDSEQNLQALDEEEVAAT